MESRIVYDWIRKTTELGDLIGIVADRLVDKGAIADLNVTYINAPPAFVG
jgi:hypothetical protein